MRTVVRHGVTLVAIATLALACGERRSTRAPASDPAPQAAFNDPTVQRPNDPLATNNHHSARKPFNDPEPQRSALQPSSPQVPFEDPVPQKPFYGPGTTSPEDRTQAKTEKPLTDAEVIGVTAAANDGEIQMAEIALKKATAPDVKQFAGMMKSHHQTALQKGKTLQTKTKISGAESDVSSTLKSDVGSTVKDLRTKEGKAFDRAYLDSQVKTHKDVLTVIDNRLIPSATNGEVRGMLTEMRRTVADHLVKAEDLQKKLEPTATSSRIDSAESIGLGVPGPKEQKQPAGKQESQSKARSSGADPLDRRQ